MKKLFLDTNVIIDVLVRLEEFFLASANILELGATGRCHLYATALSFINGLYISRRTLGSVVALEHIKVLRNFVDVSPMGKREFDQALLIEGKDVEDNLQYCSALASHCNAIITRNKKDFPQNGPIAVFTPMEYLEQFK